MMHVTAAAMLPFLIKIGSIEVRNSFAYLTSYLLFQFNERFFSMVIYKRIFLSRALSDLAKPPDVMQQFKINMS